MTVPAVPYSYAILRIVPHEARGEFINAGVILFCAEHKFLDARIAFDPTRLRRPHKRQNPSDRVFGKDRSEKALERAIHYLLINFALAIIET